METQHVHGAHGIATSFVAVLLVMCLSPVSGDSCILPATSQALAVEMDAYVVVVYEHTVDDGGQCLLRECELTDELLVIVGRFVGRLCQCTAVAPAAPWMTCAAETDNDDVTVHEMRHVCALLESAAADDRVVEGDDERRRLLPAVVHRLRVRLEPRVRELRTGLIHSAIDLSHLVMTSSTAGDTEVAGIACCANHVSPTPCWIVSHVANCMAAVISASTPTDTVTQCGSLFSGVSSEFPLTDAELSVLPMLIAARLALQSATGQPSQWTAVSRFLAIAEDDFLGSLHAAMAGVAGTPTCHRKRD